MSLADRLMKVSPGQETAGSLEVFKGMSLEEMDQYPVTFGKTHLGKAYIEIWTSQVKWLQWFTKTYEGSTKTEHLKLLHYTTLMIERAELEGEKDAQQMPMIKAKAKAKSKTMPMQVRLPESDPEDDDVWLAAEMASQPSYAVDPVMQENVNALQGRMTHMENALGEILSHLRNNSS